MDTICAVFLWKRIEIGVLGDDSARERACPLKTTEGDFMEPRRGTEPGAQHRGRTERRGLEHSAGRRRGPHARASSPAGCNPHCIQTTSYFFLCVTCKRPDDRSGNFLDEPRSLVFNTNFLLYNPIAGTNPTLVIMSNRWRCAVSSFLSPNTLSLPPSLSLTLTHCSVAPPRARSLAVSRARCLSLARALSLALSLSAEVTCKHSS